MPHYLHYYVFFLYYAIYYHTIRSTTDIIDENMKPQHEQHLVCVKNQLKYLQYIIKESRTRSISSKSVDVKARQALHNYESLIQIDAALNSINTKYPFSLND
jgi:hypothetical protein